MKRNIVQLKEDLQNAKSRQSEAAKEVQRIERDIKEFSSNKDGKLVELQSSLETLKKTLSKSSASVKLVQKELQSARLESEQAGGDLAAAQEQLVEVDLTLKNQQEEIEGLMQEQARVKVKLLYTLREAVLIEHRMLMTWHKRIWMTREQNCLGSTRSFER